jgi:hypothetical protein
MTSGDGPRDQSTGIIWPGCRFIGIVCPGCMLRVFICDTKLPLGCWIGGGMPSWGSETRGLTLGEELAEKGDG